MNSHLNHEQLCNLLLASRPSDASVLLSEDLEISREHVSDCAICAAELADLRHSLAIFRESTDAWAHHAWDNQQIARNAASIRPRPISIFQRPAAWATAAAVLLFGAAMPLTLHHLSETQETGKAVVPAATAPAASTQSDEALLLEINQTLSSSVPTPMQALADPTSTGTNPSNNAIRKN